MDDTEDVVGGVQQMLATPAIADVLESERFKQFLDHVPVAIAVAELQPSETITYCNLEFERLAGRKAEDVQGSAWSVLPGVAAAVGDDTALNEAVVDDDDYIGRFSIENEDGVSVVDAWSNVIESEEGVPLFRLVALAAKGRRLRSEGEQADQMLRDKDVLLRELQHRVKNNLQMITALIRMEARNMPEGETGERFDRLAGRISSLATLYDLLSGEGATDAIDLGTYLTKVASSVMATHAVEGIRLNLDVVTWPVSINVAMPTGLVVNEVMTNALKYAFEGRDGGTITLSSHVDETGCRIVVADDGAGLPDGVVWPQPGRLGWVITESLKENAKARVHVHSSPGNGLRVEIFFARQAAEPADQ